ncbi:hypothetical protein KORDIASMS9_04716 [Kordia sp. SMS9]|uniref:T9SS type A sorting domain-containing protein n=1 Tax=Kordia sp. SMS9 TaxID=2282170 RepID=UPI000E0DC80D|nr:T9SS type A sorting domain-containing protein [Kordia sp. SMS9]AXG72442.1 hypothetical protein KORDIASMS9_04716 [Kordia sp. SMS9]
MKKNYTHACIAVLLCITCAAFAQVTEIATTGLLNPVGVAKNGNTLFISSVGNMSIRQKDLSNTSTTDTTVFLPNFDFGVFLTFQGNDLYIPMLANNKVVKIDVTNPTAVLTDVVTNVPTPMGLAFRNNELYISLRQDAKIVKVDLTQSNPTAVDVVTGIPGTFVNGIAFRGDELFITHGNTISKINVTDANPVLTEVLIANSNPVDVAFDGNFLYFSLPSDTAVARADVTQAMPVIDTFLTLPNGPWGLLIDGSDLYIAEQTGSRVVLFDLTTLSVAEASARRFTYYPNPTKDVLHISGLTNSTSYVLSDQQGKEIMEGTLNSTDKLDVSSVANGIYFLRLNDYEVKKIVKY